MCAAATVAASAPVADDPSIFIGNLPQESISESLLTELLLQFGPLAGPVRLLRDAAGRPRGSAFADYLAIATAKYAVNVLDGLNVGGRSIRVNLARPKPSASPIAQVPPAALPQPTTPQIPQASLLPLPVSDELEARRGRHDGRGDARACNLPC